MKHKQPASYYTLSLLLLLPIFSYFLYSPTSYILDFYIILCIQAQILYKNQRENTKTCNAFR